MEDTQRSQPISMENQEIAMQIVCDSDIRPAGQEKEVPPLLAGESSFTRLVTMARANPEMVFTSPAHRIDLSLLKKSF